MGLTPRARGTRAICLLAALLGLLALVAAARVDAPPGPWWLFVIFAAGLTATRLVPVHLTHGGQSEALHLDEVFFLPMVVLLSPLQMVSAVLVAALVGSAWTRRGGLKLLFNVGVVTASTGLGIEVARLLGAQQSLSITHLLGGTVGGLVACTSASLAVNVVISQSTGTPLRTLVVDGAGLRVATWVGSLSLGTLVAAAAYRETAALALAVAPILVLQVAYAHALRQRRERVQVDELYEAAARLHSTVSSEQVRGELLASAQELVGASQAQVVPLSAAAPPPDCLRVPLDDECAVEVRNRATGGSWTPGDLSRLQALAAVASGALANAVIYEQMQAITRSLGEGVLALDGQGRITFTNPAAEELLGWQHGELVGRLMADAVDPGGQVAGAWVHLPRVQDGQTVRLDEQVVRHRDGSPLDVALTASPVRRDGAVVGAVVVFRDIRDRRALERRLVHQAFHDPLTGLPNRALFLDRLEHARARGKRSGGAQAVLFLDLDRFKVINDSLGHQVGDQVLQTVASRLIGIVRPSDTVSRFGGDEFTVLLEQVEDVSEAALAAERILRALQLPMTAGGREVVVTVSIGIALGVRDNATADLLAAADIAMYQAKSQGKNRYVVASPDADEHALARLDLEMQLRRALTRGELEVYYQPVVHARDGELYGLEALVRWRHPTRGLLEPGDFMDLAEDTGLVLPLGDWVLEQACRAAVEWGHRHPQSPAVIAVNLSARQFGQPDLCDRVAQVLAATGLDPRLLCLEITETVVMEDTRATEATLRALKHLDVRLAIDDFGTGYSSLSYLQRFPVDVVKIDKAFVAGLATGPVDREIVQAVIRLAEAVGMKTVAEGVETVGQREQLRLLGCSLLQGFLISRPAPLPQVERLVFGSRPAVPGPRQRHLGIAAAG